MSTNSIFFKNATWVAAAQFGLLAIQMVALIAITHYLNSSTYGLFAIAIAILNFTNLFKDLGTSIDLISKKNISQNDVDAAHTVNLLSGCLSSILIMAVAYPIGLIYKNQDLAFAIFLLGLNTAITSTGIAKLALLQRYCRFKEIAVIDISACLISALVAVAAANAGFGIYSLVIQGVLSGILTTLSYNKIDNTFHTKIIRSSHNLKHVLNSGSHVTTYNLIHYITRNGDVFIIGKLFGEALLGMYTMSLRFVMLPYQIMTATINKALLPVLALRQNNIDDLRSIFIATNKVTITLSGGFIGLLWIFNTEIVSLSLGKEWMNLTKVLHIFSPSGFVFAVTGVFNTFLITTDNKKLLVKLGFLQMILTLGSIGVSFLGDFHTMVALMTGANFLFGILFTIKTCNLIGITFLQYVRGTSAAFFMVLGYMGALALLGHIISNTMKFNAIDFFAIFLFLSVSTILLIISPSLKIFVNIDHCHAKK